MWLVLLVLYCLVESSLSEIYDTHNQQKIFRQTSRYFGREVSISGDFAIVASLEISDGVFFLERDLNDFGKWKHVNQITGLDNLNEGVSVSISGDDAIIGEPGNDFTGLNSGAVHYLKRNVITEIWEKYFSISGFEKSNYGTSVAISGDYAIVGEQKKHSQKSGVAYINKKSIQADGSIIWKHTTKLTPILNQTNDLFGSIVSISGNYAVVGVRLSDGIAGAVYVFEKQENSEDWIQMAKLTESDRDYFGSDVSVSGNQIIVGTENEVAAGSAYIYQLDDETNQWILQKKLTAADSDLDQYFGNKVSIFEDFAVVAAKNSAYIYKRNSSTGNWEHYKKITSSSHYVRSVFMDKEIAFVGYPTTINSSVFSVPLFECFNISNYDQSSCSNNGTCYYTDMCACNDNLRGEMCDIWKCDDHLDSDDYYWKYEDHSCIMTCNPGKFIFKGNCVNGDLIFGSIFAGIGIVFTLSILIGFVILVFVLAFNKKQKNEISKLGLYPKEDEIQKTTTNDSRV